MREFRSSLPFILHGHDLEIEPLTIEIGDYILSPDICVERKSIQDLISSFSDGRLYYQAEAMCANFKSPILLIEFDPGKAFSMQSYTDFRAELSVNDLTSKLVLLYLHFPKLKVIWSCSPNATAEIFLDLKKDNEDPNVSSLHILGQGDEFADSSARDILLRLPGITNENYRKVMKRFTCLRDLFNCNFSDISDLIGPIHARKLFNFVN